MVEIGEFEIRAALISANNEVLHCVKRPAQTDWGSLNRVWINRAPTFDSIQVGELGTGKGVADILTRLSCWRMSFCRVTPLAWTKSDRMLILYTDRLPIVLRNNSGFDPDSGLPVRVDFYELAEERFFERMIFSSGRSWYAASPTKSMIRAPGTVGTPSTR